MMKQELKELLKHNPLWVALAERLPENICEVLIPMAQVVNGDSLDGLSARSKFNRLAVMDDAAIAEAFKLYLSGQQSRMQIQKIMN